jgi:CDP-alcohol phosphatidyltransferase
MSSRWIAPNPGSDPQHSAHELVDVLGRDQDRHRRDAGHPTVEERLALHHRHRSPGADVPQAQHPRAVGADRHRAADHRVAAGEGRLLGDRRADPRHAGGVDVAHVLEGRKLGDRLDRQLAALVGPQGTVEVRDHPHPLQLGERAGNPLRLSVVTDLHGDLADRAIATQRDGDDVADQAPGLADALADLRQLARDVRLLDPVHVANRHCGKYLRSRLMLPINLPNVLTLLRVLAVPVIVVALLGETPNGDALAAGVFALAALTDGLDGYIARRRRDVTTFGKTRSPTRC